MSKQEIRQELSEFLLQNYNGSFSRMACDYIHATGLPQFRNKGYATNAIKAVIQPYSSTSIMKIVMDIADSNEASNNVAMKLEFLKEANNPMYDKQNPLIGAHYKWFNTIPYMIKIFGKS